jgi:hypothetical protein
MLLALNRFHDCFQHTAHAYSSQLTPLAHVLWSPKSPPRYEPDTTAAIILTGGDEEAEAAAAEVCREAEITVVVKQSEDGEPTTYLTHGKMQD